MRNNSTNLEVNKKPTRLKKMLTVVCVAFLIYILSGILITIFQEKLIFYPQPISKEMISHIDSKHPEAQPISITMKDSTEVNGWLVRGRENSQRLCIYFGGNGDEASSMIEQAARFPDWSFVLMNYRGYGQSNGSPNEKHLFSDAVQIYDYFSTRQEAESVPIVVMGRSIGSGVAVYLAQNRPVAGIILSTPYDSLLSVTKEKIPIYPIDFMLRNRFDSLGRAASINKPVLFLTAEKDRLIHPAHAETLAGKWGGKVYMVEITGEDHNSIVESEEYWESIDVFLDGF
ncbi:MAG: alpha/beta hydrolase [Syntrophomonadaceae bacterium]|mgnify:CR=1 FL=1|jgi:alpha-beta hydrolase superfamily lysophospholipase